MAYQAIYRKWRPTTFEDVVGQSHITDTLKTEIKTNRLAHAYLFCGTRGTGKTTTAKILSRAVNCENILPNGNPCNECSSCKGILANTIMDVIEIDAASNNGVDNIRELRDEISYTPANVKYKIYIIDEVHMLSPGAFNALLKTLEEPPSHAIFILATTEPHKIPATIQSRCQRFDFRRISSKNIAGRIGEITSKDGIKISQDAIRLVAQLGDGSMRDALSILDLCSGIEGEITRKDIENVTGAVSRTTLIDLASSLISGDISASLVSIDKILEQGRETATLIDELIMTFRDIMICKILSDPADTIDKSEEDIKTYSEIANTVSKESLLHIIKVLSETALLCKTSTNPQVMLEAAAVKICDPSTDATSEAFASRVEKLETMIATGGAFVPKPQVTEQKAVEIKDEVDDEEYVCEVEEYSDDDIPPFDISSFEPPFEQAVEEPKAEAEVETQDEIPTQEPTAESTSVDAESVFETMMKVSPAMGSILKQSVIKLRENVHFVVFGESIYKNAIKDNQQFLDALKNALGCEHLKIVTEDEFNNIKTEDPLDDIFSMADGNNQISIY